MKKIVLFIHLLLAVCSVSFGFDLSVGAAGIVGHSSWVGADYSDFLETYDFKNAIKLNIGISAFATIGFMDVLAIQPEVRIVGTGDRFKEDVEPYGYEGYVRYYDRLIYLEPSVLVKIRLGKYNVIVGPLIMVRLGSGKFGYTAKDPSISDYEDDYADDDFARIVFAATGGFGLSYPHSSGIISFELRGHYCFQNVLNKDIYSIDLYQYRITIEIGFSVPLLK